MMRPAEAGSRTVGASLRLGCQAVGAIKCTTVVSYERQHS
jgi:hypothetical protein